jgi:hypothetical protein
MRHEADSGQALGDGGRRGRKNPAGERRSRWMAAGEAGGVGRAQRDGEP